MISGAGVIASISAVSSAFFERDSAYPHDEQGSETLSLTGEGETEMVDTLGLPEPLPESDPPGPVSVPREVVKVLGDGSELRLAHPLQLPGL